MLHHRIVSTSLLATSLLSSFMVLPSTGLAQPYPSQMIRLVVPSAAGTPPDIISRIVANELTQTEGWRVIVENKPGGMQTIGGIEVLKQPADGYTVMSAALAAAVAPALMSNVIFRLDGDFAPVIKLAAAHHILVVHPSVPANSLPEFVGLLKSQPDKLTFSSGGFGTPAHMAGELFKLQTGVRATHVPYSALPRAIGDLLSGTNQYQFITPLAVLDLIATGKLRALAVTSATRLAVLPDVPTVVEEGFGELIIQDWFGLLVKSGTPNEIIITLNTSLNRVLAKPNVRDAITKLGAEPSGGSPVEFGKFVSSQMTYWAKVVKDSGMKMHQ